MDSTINMIFTIVGGALTLLTVYGVIKLNRKFFLSGICFFSLLPMIGEGMAYNADKASVHVIVFMMFLAQFVLAFPSQIIFGQENVAANKLTTKIGLALLIFNITGAVFIFCLNAGVPSQFGYYHIVISLALVYLMVKRNTGNGAAWVQ
jgi:hypothetical protein